MPTTNSSCSESARESGAGEDEEEEEEEEVRASTLCFVPSHALQSEPPSNVFQPAGASTWGARLSSLVVCLFVYNNTLPDLPTYLSKSRDRATHIVPRIQENSSNGSITSPLPLIPVAARSLTHSLALDRYQHRTLGIDQHFDSTARLLFVG